MTIKTYARIDAGTVAELFSTPDDISNLFNAALTWVEVPEGVGVLEGWRYDGSAFEKPATVPVPGSPSLDELRATLQQLSAQIAALTETAGTPPSA